jgi:hypothetical protein
MNHDKSYLEFVFCLFDVQDKNETFSREILALFSFGSGNYQYFIRIRKLNIA